MVCIRAGDRGPGTNIVTALALDIGGTKVLAALVDGPQVLAAKRLPTDLSRGPDGLLATVADAVAGWCGRYDRVGAAVTGVILDGRWQALNRAILDLVTPVPLTDMLETIFRCPALAVNDTQAAAWGEFRFGAGAQPNARRMSAADLVFLSVSTGVGGGIVAQGRLMGGLAGHFGQVREASGERFEDLASGRWIAAEARAQGRADTAEDVFANAGDVWAEAILDASAHHLARLCRNIQLTVDPAVIVVGGGVGLAPGYLDRARRALDPPVLPVEPTIVPAALGTHAGVVGVGDLSVSVRQPQTNREIA